MAVPLPKPRSLPLAEERRRHQRVKVNLLGRYMLADRREFPCQVVNMSPGGIAIVAPVIGNPGERVIAYVDHLGRLEGKIARTLDNGFAMTIEATLRKRDKLAAQLTWLANRHILNLPEDRRHGRFIPKKAMARLILPNGNNVTCRVIDLSESGAAVSIAPELRPVVGSMVTIGKAQGRVVRHIEDGFAIEFTRSQHSDFIEENVTGE
jgi:PilZ domain